MYNYATITWCITVVNPRRACAARVTVVVLCVRLSATILALQATYEAAYECYKSKKNNLAISLKQLRFERYGVKTSLKANMHNERMRVRMYRMRIANTLR